MKGPWFPLVDEALTFTVVFDDPDLSRRYTTVMPFGENPVQRIRSWVALRVLEDAKGPGVETWSISSRLLDEYMRWVTVE